MNESNHKSSSSRIEKTKSSLSKDEYYEKVFSYYKHDVTNGSSNSASSSIDKPAVTATDEGSEEYEHEKAHSSSVLNPDYTDEGSPLLSVTGAVRNDPGRMRRRA